MPTLVADIFIEIGADLWWSEAGAFLIQYSTVIGYAVTIGASVAYSTSQNAKLKNALKNGVLDNGRNVMSRDPLAFQRKVYGEIPLAGPIPFMHTTGAKNEYLHLLMLVAGHECNQLGTIYFEGPEGLEAVALDGTGTNGGGAAIGKYAGYFFCNKYLGDPNQAADAVLVAAAPGVWTANHRLRGNAYVYLQFKYSTDIFPNGLPTVRVLTQGAKVLDPRVGILTKTCDMVAGNAHIGCNTAGLTVGMAVVGSGVLPGTKIVSIDGSGTFFTVNIGPLLTNTVANLGFGVAAFSANAALCVADYLADFKFGRSIPWTRINITDLPGEANICDEVIVTDTGTEARYEINGTVNADQDATADLLTALAGRIIDSGGVWSIIAGAYRAPTVDFTDDDLVGPFTVQPRQSMRESYSGVRGTFISAINGWQPADFPPAKNDSYTDQDGGRRRWKDVAYGYTISSPCSQRLAKADLERGRQQIVIQGTFKLKAFQIKCCDTIRVTRAVLGWVNKEFEVLDWALKVMSGAQNNLTLAIVVTARETAAGVWTWANGEETTVDLAPNTTLPDPNVVNAPTGLTLLTDTTTVIVQPDGTVQPRIKVTWNTPNNIYIESGGRTEVEFRPAGGPDYIPWNGRVPGATLLEYITDIKVGLQYDVRVRFVNEIGVRSTWASATSAVAVGDTVAPNSASALVVTANPGFLRATWTPSTSNTVNEYSVYRATAGAGGPFTFMADTPNSQFDDPTVVSGTTYWYKVFARSRSEFTDAGIVSSGVIALLPAVGAAVPSNPTAPTLTGTRGNYVANGGSVLAYENIHVAALPTNAIWQNLLFRRSGGSDWVIGAQVKNTVATDIPLDDLSPGVVYEYAMQAWSAAGGSAIITAAATFTANTKTTLPAAPSGGALSADSTLPAANLGSNVVLFGCRITWTFADQDVVGIQAKATFTDTDGAVDYTWYNSVVGPINKAGKEGFVTIYNETAVAGFVRIRCLDSSGNYSNWFRIGNANGSCTRAVGDMSLQSKSGVAITGGTITGITDIAIADGGTGSSSASGALSNLGGAAKTSNLSDLSSASTAKTNLGIRRASHVVTLAGGAPTEKFTWNHGYGVLQSNLIAQMVDGAGLPQTLARLDSADAGNNSNNSVIQCFTYDGTNIPNGLYRINMLSIE